MLNKSLDSDSTPRFFFNRIGEITPDIIKKAGGKAVAVDIDNTLFYDLSVKLLPGAAEWVDSMKKAGIPVVILSNAAKKRVTKIAALLELPFIGKAHKPAPEGYEAAAETAGVDIKELVMIGDQLFTDVQGANLSGAISMRVKFVRRERFGALRFYLLRKAENRYLIHAGYGDKI